MLKHLYTIVCHSSRVDRDSNTITINDIIEDLQFKAELHEDIKLQRNGDSPISIPYDFEVTTSTYRENKDTEEEGLLKVKLLDPKQLLLGEFTMPLKFGVGSHRVRGRMKLESFVATVAGIYNFKTYLVDKDGEEKHCSTTPVYVALDLN